MARYMKRKTIKSRYIKTRDILGTEVFKNTRTGKEFFYDFNKRKVVRASKSNITAKRDASKNTNKSNKVRRK